MCKEFFVTSEIERITNRHISNPDVYSETVLHMHSVICNSQSYVITDEKPNEIQKFKFGMTPFYSMRPHRIINVCAEEVIDRKNCPVNPESISNIVEAAEQKKIIAKRCLVFANAYQDWSDKNKPYLISLQNVHQPFVFAGVYELWKNPETEDIVRSFAVITTTANRFLQSIGINRMPVILSQSNELKWLSNTNSLRDVRRIFVPYPAEEMCAVPIITAIDYLPTEDPNKRRPGLIV
jgi:putative SOS response-associated peptidase YedK